MLLLLYHKSPEVANSSLNGETFKSTRVVATVLCEVEGDFKVLKFLAQPDGEFRYIGAELN